MEEGQGLRKNYQGEINQKLKLEEKINLIILNNIKIRNNKMIIKK